MRARRPRGPVLVAGAVVVGSSAGEQDVLETAVVGR